MNSERNIALDYFKVVLAVSVIMFHSHFSFGEGYPFLDYIINNSIFKVAVPFFFVVTGYYACGLSDESFIKQLKRVGRLYFGWVIIYFYFIVQQSIGFSFEGSVSSFFKLIFIGYSHLWYLVALFLAMCILYYFRRASLVLVFCVSVLFFLLGFFVQLIGLLSLSESDYVNQKFKVLYAYRNFVFVGVPFVFLGWCLNKSRILERLEGRTVIILFLLVSILHFFELLVGYIIYPHVGLPLLSLFLMVPILFVFFVKYEVRSKNKDVSNVSAMMYLIHPLIIILMSLFFSPGNYLVLNVVLVTFCFSFYIFKTFPVANINKVRLFFLKAIGF